MLAMPLGMNQTGSGYEPKYPISSHVIFTGIVMHSQWHVHLMDVVQKILLHSMFPT